MNKNEITPIQIAIRIVLIIIVIVILVLVSFAFVRFIPKAINSFSSFRTLFITKERLVVSLNNSTVSFEDSVVLSLQQKGGKAVGFYELEYSCSKIDSKTYLEIGMDGEQGEIYCDEAFTLPGNPSSSSTHSVIITPGGNNVSYDQPMTITVSHKSATTTLTSASVVLTITKTEAKKPKEEDPIVEEIEEEVVTSTSPDFSVRLGDITVNTNGKAKVTFYVTNKGERNSGSWTFRAQLPRSGQTIYNSPFQPSIPPGGTSTMFLSFDSSKAGTINIFIDYANLISESNESNNNASAVLK